ncbi:23S rRNA (uracil(1939)-C(5))-methyltransferase RlmD [Gammaproteobacteria bacterium]|nr:23S rRNA (uracil(1939)-C(5))-methyltransferase RlmD [Gammaproteobacteria bacterium]
MTTIDISITGLTNNGRGIAEHDGTTWFVDDALPGEIVRAAITNKRKRARRAKSLITLQASADRVVPRCEYFGVCGGCVMQHLSIDGQLRHKQLNVVAAMKRHGVAFVAERMKGISPSAWGYRRKGRLSVRYVPKKGGVLVGFRELEKSYVTDLKRCHTLVPELSALLPSLKAQLQQLGGRERIPQIEIASGTNVLAIIVRYLTPCSEQDLLQLISFGREQNVRIYLQSGGPDTIVPLEKQGESLSYRIRASGDTIKFLPTDFIQVNDVANQEIVDSVLQMLAPTSRDRVLELFCGLGNLTLPVASSIERVVGVDYDDGLLRRAKDNALFNHKDNVEFRHADLTENPGGQWWAVEGFTKLLLDPPRSGALEILTAIVPTLAPERIVYASCNPETLARDAALLTARFGYRLEAIRVVDMFAHTGHVETIALFV